jgi:hypothetical protein
MDAHRSIEDYQRFLVELYKTLEQQLEEAKSKRFRGLMCC